jgi:uncharacterized delta-60 repeat protein
MVRLRFALVVAALVGASLATASPATAGPVDPLAGFGTNGVVHSLPVGGNGLQITDTDVALDGSFVAVGESMTYPHAAVLASYDTAGQLISSFGVGGVFTYLPANDLDVLDVVRQSDGKFVIAAVLAAFGAVMIRVNSNGTIDAGFGTNGVVSQADFFGAQHLRVAIQPNGGILLAGSRAGDPISIYRYGAAAGAPDMTFGGAGVATVPCGGCQQQAIGALITLPDNRFVAVTYGVATVIRQFLADGSTDSSFTDPGAGFASGTQILAIERAPGGDLYLGGVTSDLLVARIHANGSFDETFGEGGISTVDLTRRDSRVSFGAAYALSLQSNGKVVVAGTVHLYSVADYPLLVRLDHDGTLDDGFDDGFLQRFGVNADDGLVFFDAQVLADKSIVAAGDYRTAQAQQLGVGAVKVAGDRPDPSRLHAITPARILDTRLGIGAPAGALSSNNTLTMAVTGVGGVPTSGVSAVVLNVTAVNPEAYGYATIWPTGALPGGTSSLNLSIGQTVANLVTSKVGVGGRVSLFNGAPGSTHYLADVVGWYDDGSVPGGGNLRALNPSRVLDTRTGIGASVGPLTTNQSLRLHVTGRGGVPSSGVTAVALNITATDATAVSYLSVWPSDQPRPTASNLNFTPRQTVPNLVIVAVPPSGDVDIYNAFGEVHVLADLVAWFDDGSGPPATFTALSPHRLLDTRQTPHDPLLGGQTGELLVVDRAGVPSTGVSAVLVNVTATSDESTSYLTVWPTGSPRPETSNVNITPHAASPNLVMATVGVDGTISIYNAFGSIDIIVDILGWWS